MGSDPKVADEPLDLTHDVWRRLLDEGRELRRQLEARVAPMRRLTPDDWRARSR